MNAPRAVVAIFGSCCIFACGAQADSSESALTDDGEPTSREPVSREPVSREPVSREPVSREPVSREPGLPAREEPRGISPALPGSDAISRQTGVSCVALPAVPPREPVLSYEAGCAVTSFTPLSDDPMSSSGEDARALLVGRWKLCGEVVYYGGAQHAGLEFGSNGRNQLLWDTGGNLRAMSGGPQGVYYLLGSGQFMQRGELTFGGFAANVRFDSTLTVMQLEGEGSPPLRYVRVAADERSAAANSFATATARCSMVGVWDTLRPSNNPEAAFAFNERGEWFGGAWGSDLCADHSMYGTYNLETRGGPVVDNFDVPPVTEFELVTNVGAGVCAFWFNAGFLPTFSDDCNRVHLQPTWDNCTGGRGYLDLPGDDLIRRVP